MSSLCTGGDKYLAGFNKGNTVTFKNVVIEGSPEGSFDICRNFGAGQKANTLADAANVEGCIFGPGDITFA